MIELGGAVTESAHTSQTPSSGDVNNGAAITVGGTFTFAADGTVSAVRFWAPTTNSGTYTAALYVVTADDSPAGSGTGTLLASASVASGSVTAGQFNNIPLGDDVDVDTDHAYRAAVHCTSGRIVATSSAFASAGITNGNVTAIQSGADPVLLGSLVNGTFTEGASLAYPASSFSATDYFVDVVYLEGPPPDTAVGQGPPIVSASGLGYQTSNSGIGSSTTRSPGGYV